MKTRRMLGAGATAGALLLAGAVATPAFAADQTVTDLAGGSLTAESLVEMLVGDGTPVSNVVYTGHDLAAGTFSGFEDPFGIDAGVVLSSGAVADGEGQDSAIIGPNENGSTSASFGEPGDADLEALITETTHDAAVLEFDFVPTTSTVTFSYVFGSEEYEEYVNAGVNDVFGFFVNGTNYATLPDGTVVSIDTINQDVNTAYFKSNHQVTTYNTELDGFTTVLSFEAPVNVGETNHIKLAIADAGDRVWDSAVMIAAGSFRSNTAPVANDVATETEFESPVTVTLEGTDADGDALTYSIVDGPLAEEGTLTAIDGNQVTFTPADGFTGNATFTYLVNDGSVNSEPATVTVTVLEEGVVIPTPTPTETTTPPTTPVETTTPPTTPVETTTEPTDTAIPTSTEEPTSSEIPTQTGTESPKPDSDDDLAKTGAEGLGVMLGLAAALVLAGGAIFATAKLRRQV